MDILSGGVIMQVITKSDQIIFKDYIHVCSFRQECNNVW